VNVDTKNFVVDVVNATTFHPKLPLFLSSTGERRFRLPEELEDEDEMKQVEPSQVCLWSFTHPILQSSEVPSSDSVQLQSITEASSSTAEALQPMAEEPTAAPIVEQTITEVSSSAPIVEQSITQESSSTSEVTPMS
jgi:hypothetical protein